MQPSPYALSCRATQHIFAFLSYTTLACILTWPLMLHVSTHFPALQSEISQDVWQNAWNMWWVREALVVQHTNPYHTMMLLYPHGASLSLHTLNMPLGLIALPLLPLFGIVITYNMLTLLVLILSGYCTFLLAQHIVHHPPAAWVAGAIVLCSPQRLNELFAAQLPTISDYGVPLTLLCVLIALERQSRRWTWLAAAMLLLAGLSSWYHLFHAVVLLAAFLGWRVFARWRGRRLSREGISESLSEGTQAPPVFPSRRGETPDSPPCTGGLGGGKQQGDAWHKDISQHCSVIAKNHLFPSTSSGNGSIKKELVIWVSLLMASVLVLAPFVLPVIVEALTTSYAQKSTDLLFSANVLQLLPATARGNVMLLPNHGQAYTFALVPWILMLVGVFRAPRQSAVWVWVALVCLVLSLGPHLSIGRVETGIPLPYAVLWKFPVLSTFRAPARLLAVVTLMVALIAAIGLAHLWYTRSIAMAWGGALVLVGVMCFEVIRVPFPLVHAGVSPFYKQVANEPGEWSILEFPFDRPDHLLLDMYAQTYHGKYILTGQTSRHLPRLAYKSIPQLDQIESGAIHPDIVSLSSSTFDEMLRALRVYYVVFHRDTSTYQRTERQVATAHELIGPLTQVYSDSHLLAYRLDRVANWLDGPGKTTRVDPPLFLGLNLSWPKPEHGNHGLSRWLLPEGGGLWTYTKQRRRVVLDALLYSLPGERPLELWLNGEHIQTMPISAGLTPRRYRSTPFALPSGPSLIELHAPQGGVSPHSLGIGTDTRPLSFSIHHVDLREVK